MNENPVKEVFGGPQNFAHLALPPRRVWMAHLGRIGELKGVDTDALVLVHSFFDSYDLAVETFRQRAGGQGVRREILQGLVVELNKMQRLIVTVGGPLYDQITHRTLPEQATTD